MKYTPNHPLDTEVGSAPGRRDRQVLDQAVIFLAQDIQARVQVRILVLREKVMQISDQNKNSTDWSTK